MSRSSTATDPDLIRCSRWPWTAPTTEEATRLRNCFIYIGALLLLAACSASEPTVAPTATLNPQAAQGKRLFSQHCASCHATEPDTVIVGPSLAGIAERAADRVSGVTARGYMEESILQPGAFVVSGFDDAMPANLGKRLSGNELDALIAYLLTLEGN